MTDRATIIRLERTWADNLAGIARTLAAHDPHGGSRVFTLADGTVVLSGRGLFVNEARSIGFDQDLTEDDLLLLEAHSAAAGVAAGVEVTDLTRPTVVDTLIQRGYRPDKPITALTRPFSDLPDPHPHYVIEPARLGEWQATSAKGWDASDPTARAASDAYAAAAAESDDPGLLVARASEDRRTVGCSALAIRDGIATLGGMATMPTERRQGVQSAMIGHRLRFAADRGCELATATCAAGSNSERNLLRHGFTKSHTQTVYRRPSGDETDVESAM